MKRYILIAITAISIMSFAEVKINKRAIIEKYRKGTLGALPDPELINSLLRIKVSANRNQN